MKHKHWKTAAAALLVLFLGTGCGTKNRGASVSHSTEPEKTAEPTPAPAPGKKKVHDFDPDTNQVIALEEFRIQIPQAWKEGNDGWYAMRNGIAEVSMAVITDASGMEQMTEDLLMKDPSVFGRLFDGGTYSAASDTMVTVHDIPCRRAEIPTTMGEVAGILYVQACLCTDPAQIAYIIVFEPSDHAYDFSADIRDILDSLERDAETVERWHRENEHIAEIQAQLDAAELTAATEKLEYSKKTADLLSLVKCSDPAVTVTTDAKVDLKKTGRQTVTYLLTLEGERREITKTFEIVDTKAPEIRLKQNAVTLEYGASYDPYTNIESVSDPVDGALKAVRGKKDAKNSTYYIDGSVDTKRAGSYELTVYASDANANISKKSFVVKVDPEPYTEPLYDYIGNANTGKFHYPDCRSVRQMKEGNKRYFNGVTRDYMLKLGYIPCGICNP